MLSYGFDCKANEDNMDRKMADAFKNTTYGSYTVPRIINKFLN